MTIDQIIDGIIRREGGYVANPHDRGGPTRYGITEAVARANGYGGYMDSLPEDLARRIYHDQYWTRPGFNQVAELSPAIAEELADTGVNMGPTVAVTMLQRVLNVMNQEEKFYQDVAADGYIGTQSLSALSAFLSKRGTEGEAVLLKALNCLQGARYIEIAEHRPSQEAFVFGWLRERVA